MELRHPSVSQYRKCRDRNEVLCLEIQRQAAQSHQCRIHSTSKLWKQKDRRQN